MDSAKPLRILSLGAGVQSTTLLLMMIRGQIQRPDHAVFADTGWEPAEVYEHLDSLKQLMNEHEIPLHVVSAGNIRDDFMADGSRFASMPLHVKNESGTKAMIRRQCTSEYKIKPLMTKQRELAGLQAGQRCKEHRITTIIGISYDESIRMREPAFSWIKHEYPLVDLKMTRADCLKWCENHGYARPPRSACIGCPFKSRDEWRYLKTKPAQWDDAVAFDAALRTNDRLRKRFRGEAYLHSSMKPLPEVDLRSDDELGILSLFNQECEGMCGL